MDFKIANNFFKFQRVFLFFETMIFIFLFRGTILAQMPSATITETPTIASNSTTPVRKHRVAHNSIHYSGVPTRQEAHESDEKLTEDLRKNDQLKLFGTPGTTNQSAETLASPNHFEIKPGNSLAYLSWDSVPNAKQYFIYISEDGENYKRRVDSPIKNRSVVIGNLTNGKVYYFAISGFGEKEGAKAFQKVMPGSIQ